MSFQNPLPVLFMEFLRYTPKKVILMLSNLLILRPKVQLSIVMWLFNMFHVVSNNSSAWHGACAKVPKVLKVRRIKNIGGDIATDEISLRTIRTERTGRKASEDKMVCHSSLWHHAEGVPPFWRAPNPF